MLQSSEISYMEATVFIQDVFNITGLGPVPVGEVRSGVLMVGMTLTLNGKTMVLQTIEMHHEQLKQANVGDHVGFSFKGGDRKALEAVKGQEVTFVGGRTEAARSEPIKNEPIHPKGLLDTIKGFFRRS